LQIAIKSKIDNYGFSPLFEEVKNERYRVNGVQVAPPIVVTRYNIIKNHVIEGTPGPLNLPPLYVSTSFSSYTSGSESSDEISSLIYFSNENILNGDSDTISIDSNYSNSSLTTDISRRS
jgi:hypothetical protein